MPKKKHFRPIKTLLPVNAPLNNNREIRNIREAFQRNMVIPEVSGLTQSEVILSFINDFSKIYNEDPYNENADIASSIYLKLSLASKALPKNHPDRTNSSLVHAIKTFCPTNPNDFIEDNGFSPSFLFSGGPMGHAIMQEVTRLPDGSYNLAFFNAGLGAIKAPIDPNRTLCYAKSTINIPEHMLEAVVSVLEESSTLDFKAMRPEKKFNLDNSIYSLYRAIIEHPKYDKHREELQKIFARENIEVDHLTTRQSKKSCTVRSLVEFFISEFCKIKEANNELSPEEINLLKDPDFHSDLQLAISNENNNFNKLSQKYKETPLFANLLKFLTHPHLLTIQNIQNLEPTITKFARDSLLNSPEQSSKMPKLRLTNRSAHHNSATQKSKPNHTQNSKVTVTPKPNNTSTKNSNTKTDFIANNKMLPLKANVTKPSLPLKQNSPLLVVRNKSNLSNTTSPSPDLVTTESLIPLKPKLKSASLASNYTISRARMIANSFFAPKMPDYPIAKTSMKKQSKKNC